VRFVGGRKKKLIVAFHFQFADRAGWECADCRKKGLEERRRCGFIRIESQPIGRRVVWGRKGVAVDSCPISYVTAESSILLQEFQAWKLFGHGDVFSLPARTVEAVCILENQLRMERTSGE